MRALGREAGLSYSQPWDINRLQKKKQDLLGHFQPRSSESDDANNVRVEFSGKHLDVLIQTCLTFDYKKNALKWN